MKSRKKRKVPKEKAIPKSKLSKDRRMISVDQEPFRREAASHCQREMKRLEKARVQWRQFEQEDKPAFGRWMAATFGALLSEIRECADKLRTNEALIAEVEAEMFMGGWRSYGAAYDAVRRGKEGPPPEPKKANKQHSADPESGEPNGRERDSWEPETDAAEDSSELEDEVLFEEFVAHFLGINPDHLSDREYAKMFADFKKNVLGQDPQRKSHPEEGPGTERIATEARPVSVRVKEIYRLLVRRLHPDTRADSDAEVSAIWHEVQQAYADGNLERLEMLLALTDIQQESAGDHTSLFQMQSVLSELRRAYQALQRSLSKARKELAWNFRAVDVVRLEVRVRKQLEQDSGRLRSQLAEGETFIAGWTQPKRKQPKKDRRAVYEGQGHFPF
jgi:hypothetical protein